MLARPTNIHSSLILLFGHILKASRRVLCQGGNQPGGLVEDGGHPGVGEVSLLLHPGQAAGAGAVVVVAGGELYSQQGTLPCRAAFPDVGAFFHYSLTERLNIPSPEAKKAQQLIVVRVKFRIQMGGKVMENGPQVVVVFL